MTRFSRARRFALASGVAVALAAGGVLLPATALAAEPAHGPTYTVMPAAMFSSAAVDYDQLALQELDSVVNGTDTATAGFDPVMRERLTPAAVAEAWAAYQSQLGDYQAHGNPVRMKQGELTVVYVPLQMARGAGQFQIAFHENGEIAGMFLLNPTVPAR